MAAWADSTPRAARGMQCHGNATTTNFEGVLARNVEMSDYLQQLQSVETVNELIDEVYNEVVHVEPWMGRGAAGASSAFVLVRRLAQLEPTDKELTAMLQHKDSPYIRAVGFLWLRYCHDPKEWWGWIDGYLDDKEMFAPGQVRNQRVRSRRADHQPHRVRACHHCTCAPKPLDSRHPLLLSSANSAHADVLVPSLSAPARFVLGNQTPRSCVSPPTRHAGLRTVAR